jgi:hypothetical protein
MQGGAGLLFKWHRGNWKTWSNRVSTILFIHLKKTARITISTPVIDNFIAARVIPRSCGFCGSTPKNKITQQPPNGSIKREKNELKTVRGHQHRMCKIKTQPKSWPLPLHFSKIVNEVERREHVHISFLSILPRKKRKTTKLNADNCSCRFPVESTGG